VPSRGTAEAGDPPFQSKQMGTPVARDELVGKACFPAAGQIRARAGKIVLAVEVDGPPDLPSVDHRPALPDALAILDDREQMPASLQHAGYAPHDRREFARRDVDERGRGEYPVELAESCVEVTEIDNLEPTLRAAFSCQADAFVAEIHTQHGRASQRQPRALVPRTATEVEHSRMRGQMRQKLADRGQQDVIGVPPVRGLGGGCVVELLGGVCRSRVPPTSRLTGARQCVLVKPLVGMCSSCVPGGRRPGRSANH